MSRDQNLDPRELDLLLEATGEPLEETSRNALQGELAREPALEAELKGWREMAAALEQSAASPVTPSQEARDALLSAVKDRVPSQAPLTPAEAVAASAPPDPQEARSNVGRAATWLAAASLLLALGGLIHSMRVQSALEQEVVSLRSERQDLEEALVLISNRLAGTENDVDQLALALRAVHSPDARTVVLAGLEAAPQALGTAIVRQGEAVFFAYNLDPLADDQDYQLWFIDNGTPVSAGIFEADGLGNARLEVRPGHPGARSHRAGPDLGCHRGTGRRLPATHRRYGPRRPVSHERDGRAKSRNPGQAATLSSVSASNGSSNSSIALSSTVSVDSSSSKSNRRRTI